ncbi:MAG: hypothetical protein WCF92_00555 [bacterium]
MNVPKPLECVVCHGVEIFRVPENKFGIVAVFSQEGWKTTPDTAFIEAVLKIVEELEPLYQKKLKEPIILPHKEFLRLMRKTNQTDLTA